MTEHTLQLLSTFIDRYIDGCRILTPEECKHIQNEVDYALYETRVKDFHKYVLDAMPADQPNATAAQQTALDAKMEAFYDTKWTLTFGDRSVTLDNGATVYDGITDMLAEYIDDCL